MRHKIKYRLALVAALHAAPLSAQSIGGGTPAGTGTVTSVAVGAISGVTTGGAPVTTTGTLSQTLTSQTANTVFSAPNGSAGAPTFRALVGADLAAAFSQNETPSGAINGVNTSYTLAHAPVIIWLYYNGILLEPGSGNDFTYSGNAITMLYALPTGAKLRAYYSF